MKNEPNNTRTSYKCAHQLPFLKDLSAFTWCTNFPAPEQTLYSTALASQSWRHFYFYFLVREMNLKTLLECLGGSAAPLVSSILEMCANNQFDDRYLSSEYRCL
jgi:hypothetical protein